MDNSKELAYRARLCKAKRIVIKVGTHILINKLGGPNVQRIAALAKEIAQLQENHEVILVSSGAIGTGLHTLGLKRRPTNLPDLQMAAAIGQTRLQVIYQKHFAKHGVITSQVLLTHDDLKNRTRHLNARNTLQALLARKIIPIINENDVVSVDEIKFGDNDILSSLVAALINADLLILLTTPNGVLEPINARSMRRIPYIAEITQKTFALVQPKKNALSTGGMQTKFTAAQNANRIGAFAVIASGSQKNIITKIIQGEDVGTLIGHENTKNHIKHQRKQWIAFFHKPQGQIIINDCAVEALRDKGKSLLPIGITQIKGDFIQGSLVDVFDEGNHPIAKGFSQYSSDELQKIKGKNTTQIADILGHKYYDEVIHRKNLVLDIDEEQE
ncbi:MAG: glutamate 5-kinase [Legionellales bacterium]|jgi:glutamate 5-kinase